MEPFDLNMFKNAFLEEAADLLTDMEANLLELKKQNNNMELIDAVFRAMHTLKGVSSMYGFDKVSDYTHLLESIYDAIREHRITLNDDIFDVSFDSVDHVKALLSQTNTNDTNIETLHQERLADLEEIMHKYDINKRNQTIKPTITSKYNENTSQKSLWYITINCSEAFILRAIKLTYIFRDLADMGEYYIEKANYDRSVDTEHQIFNIYLISDKKQSEIEDVFLFIGDDVKISRLSGNEVFEEQYFDQQQNTELSFIDFVQSLAENSTLDIETLQEKESDKEIETVALPTSSKQAQSSRRATTNTTSFDNTTSQRISVSADKLDKLMYLVTELVTLKSQMKLACDNENMSLLKSQVEVIEKLSKEFRKNALSIRLIPIKELTVKFKRLVHDLCQNLNKKVDFVLYDADVELDKSIVSALADPLMHLIRNCIDHGIEMPQQRLQQNKSETGIVKLSAYQSGNFIFIQIADDGSGINKERVRAKAIEKRLINENEQLTDQQLYDLLFVPGFSTAQNITSVSGRGVGMDVVKKKITELRGEINVDSELGLGTSFTIKLQQTLSIMDTLLVQTGKSYFMIPLEEVKECRQEQHHFFEQAHNTLLPDNNMLIPYAYMRGILNIKGEAPVNEKIIVLKKQDQRFAIIVDNIIGEYQAVLKPVGEIFNAQSCYTGASILGDGSIAFMLDTKRLLDISH